jgi:hypothetical protein
MDRNGCVCRLLPHPTRAFPESQAGRRPSLHFRGLLRLHSRYGLLDCSTAHGGLCHEASIQPVTQLNRSSATRSYRQLPGWIPPPLVNRAVGAHVESRRGAVPQKRSVSPPRSSNAACGFPALRSPTGFISHLSAARQCASGVAGARPAFQRPQGQRIAVCLAKAPYGAASGSREPPRRHGGLPPDRPSTACRS